MREQMNYTNKIKGTQSLHRLCDMAAHWWKTNIISMCCCIGRAYIVIHLLSFLLLWPIRLIICICFSFVCLVRIFYMACLKRSSPHAKYDFSFITILCDFNHFLRNIFFEYYKREHIQLHAECFSLMSDKWMFFVNDD